MTYMFAPVSKIHASETGQGTPVVLLHGSASSSAQWRSSVDYLQGRFKVITPDLPGYGKSPHAVGNDVPTLDDIAQALRPLIEKCGEPVHLVGHCFGAAVALKCAGLFPGRVRSLTLIEPATFNVMWARSGMNAPQSAAYKQAMRASHTALEEGDAWNGMRSIVDFWNGVGAWDNSSFVLRQRLATHAAQCQKDFATLVLDQFNENDAANVVCPTLCLTGDQSVSAMPALVAGLENSIPFMQTKTIRSAGHMLPMTDPHIVDPEIGDFLAKVDRQWQDQDAAA